MRTPSASFGRWRIAFERHYARYLAGELSLQRQRRERFREVFDPTLSDATADQLSAWYIDQYLAACELYPDVEPTLAHLSAYPMGIVSNGERSQQQYKLMKTRIDHYFGPVILSGECGIAKPARGIFELACGSMGACPSQAVYVGDRPDVDAEAARSVGMHGIWLDRSGSTDHGHPKPDLFTVRTPSRHNADRTKSKVIIRSTAALHCGNL